MTALRILARVSREEFIGRDAELRQIITQASHIADARSLIVMAAPGAGASELLRQSYDQLFAWRGEPAPIHFALVPDELPVDTGRRFFQTFLQQYVAYRRVDPSLCEAPVNLADLRDLALPSDYEIVNSVIDAFDSTQSEADLLSFCFSLPHRFSVQGRATYSLIDFVPVAPFGEESRVARALATSLSPARVPLAIAGLRRHVVDLTQARNADDNERTLTLHIDRLSDDHAHKVIDVFARRYDIPTNEPTRDLMVQQLAASPFFIKQFMQAAGEANSRLTSFLDCQKLYVDEVMGGRINRHFDRLLRTVAQDAQLRKTLLRTLHESTAGDARKSSLWAWKKRLGLTAAEFERVIDTLHICELINSTSASIEVSSEFLLWSDYLRTQYRLQISSESRAHVVGTTLLATLKRAPQTMARKYRREAALGVRELMEQFNCQSVPASLFHYDRFATAYRGEDPNAIDAGLDTESDLLRLPQIVHVAAASAYSAAIGCDAERCVVAQGFEAAEYTDENEVTWLVAEVDSKLEATRELTEEWCEHLSRLARELELQQARIWLIAPEGFSEPASKLLRARQAFGSSRQQVQLLAARIQPEPRDAEISQADEFEMTIPMSDDTELIAARTVEEIARRVHFRPEAINQIKTALVEACINASEHSLSPDRKIYQRFRVEDDKLVVTVASRGVMPAQLPGNGKNGDVEPNAKSRRGWGLKLIRTLMDEVEFQRVDDGTQLRMTKYIR